MSYHSRRMLTIGASRKRKENEAFYTATSAKSVAPQTAVKSLAVSLPTAATTSSEPLPISSNRLLAGYMAHEFLTKGTLLGQKFDPARAEAVPVGSADQPKRNKLNQIQSKQAEPSGKSTPQSYAEVAHVLKSDGAHMPGVVNPTQLARWIQM